MAQGGHQPVVPPAVIDDNDVAGFQASAKHFDVFTCEVAQLVCRAGRIVSKNASVDINKVNRSFFRVEIGAVIGFPFLGSSAAWLSSRCR
jgi:hypothetical protein